VSRVFNGLLCARKKQKKRAKKKKKGKALKHVPKYLTACLVLLFPAFPILALLVEV
jgi:hypothetical protein